MIEKLSVKNFKSWADLPEMKFGKVTAIFGPNSSGKTSLIQLLLMLKQTAASRDRRVLNFGGTERDYVDLGSYEDVVYGHDLKRDIGFRLTWNPYGEVFDEFSWFESLERTTMNVELGYVDDAVVVKKLIYTAQNGTDEISILAERLPNGKYDVSSNDSPEIRLEPADYSGSRGFYEIPNPFRTSPSGRFIIQGFSEMGFDQSVQELPIVAEAFFNSIHYLGPLREYPHREYRWTGEKPTNVGVRGEYAVQTMLAELATRQSNGQTEDLVASANEWLRRFGMVERIELQPIAKGGRLYELTVTARDYQHKANLMDVGFGVSQVLPVIILAHFVPPGSFLILEQPEIHLHPKVQTELADLFLEVALKRNVQFFIESHSEHLLMRLQRRLAERTGVFEQLSTEDVRLYFCKREIDASVLEPLELDEFGRIKNWPKDFFGDPVAERRAMTEAMLERQSVA